MTQWITNNPAVADKLRAADIECERTILAARNLPLQSKIIVIREARAAKQSAYDAIYEELNT